MKKLAWLVLMVAGSVSPLVAQYDSISAAKQQEYQRRFQEALAKYNEQKPQEARAICEGILKEVPQARGSLFVAGMASLDLWEPEKAASYLENFRKLEPKDLRGIIFSIQANQALKRTAKVEALRQELLDMRKNATGNIPGLTNTEEYTRERIKGPKNTVIVVREYFNPKAAPYRVWEVRQIEGESQTIRNFDFSYSADASQATKKPDGSMTDIYMFSEIVMKDGKPMQIAVYRQESAKPDYSVFRKWVMDALENPPKPLQVAPL